MSIMTIKEEIEMLEERLANVSGQGSALKRKSIQGKIDKLKALDEPTEDEQEKEPSQSLNETSKEDIPAVKQTPLPSKWVKVTIEQVLAAEANGTLCGFDDRNMTALIKE